MDLSMWGAFHRGVSREHALLIRTTSQLLLSDLGSTNGTFVNGERLNPDEPQVLHSGDEVTFGSLTVRVFFQHTIEGEVEAY
jgi:pSer/pThr/pTyr-binding forkhead associated (FHA) protein